MSQAAAAPRSSFFRITPLAILLSLQTGVARAAFDYSAYDKVLYAYVQEGRVDYAALKRDRGGLDQYVKALGTLPPGDYEGLKDEEKIAFWINAYNAITLQVIIDHYPITRSGLKGLAFPPSSIRQIHGAWDKISRPILGREMTLDAIEHQTLRKHFREPRIHMALVCAARGCPPLRGEVYSAERLPEQFADQTRKFLAEPAKYTLDRQSGTLALSPIFKWFGEDFKAVYEGSGPAGLKANERAVITFLKDSVSPEDKDFLSGRDYKVSFQDYDWTLNDKT